MDGFEHWAVYDIPTKDFGLIKAHYAGFVQGRTECAVCGRHVRRYYTFTGCEYAEEHTVGMDCARRVRRATEWTDGDEFKRILGEQSP